MLFSQLHWWLRRKTLSTLNRSQIYDLPITSPDASFGIRSYEPNIVQNHIIINIVVLAVDSLLYLKCRAFGLSCLKAIGLTPIRSQYPIFFFQAT